MKTQPKKINIDGDEFFYQVEYTFTDCEIEYDYLANTIFYKQTRLEPEWKFLWFKSKKMISVPIVIFNVGCDIESVLLTKERARQLIMNKYQLIKRAEEISRGEII